MNEYILPGILAGLTMVSAFCFRAFYRGMRLSPEKGIRWGFYLILFSFLCGGIIMCFALGSL